MRVRPICLGLLPVLLWGATAASAAEDPASTAGVEEPPAGFLEYLAVLVEQEDGEWVDPLMWEETDTLTAESSRMAAGAPSRAAEAAPLKVDSKAGQPESE